MLRPFFLRTSLFTVVVLSEPNVAQKWHFDTTWTAVKPLRTGV
jgi:hypothetical protein